MSKSSGTPYTRRCPDRRPPARSSRGGTRTWEDLQIFGFATQNYKILHIRVKSPSLHIEQKFVTFGGSLNHFCD